MSLRVLEELSGEGVAAMWLVSNRETRMATGSVAKNSPLAPPGGERGRGEG
jgi:hypothetical protein